MPKPSFIVLLALAACGDNIPGYDMYDDPDPDGFRTIGVWVQPHPDIPLDLTLMACESWRPEGVLCASVGDPQEAHVRIHAYDGACEVEDDGSYVLGFATFGGDITLIVKCLHRFAGDPPSEDGLWPVIAHEVGHQLGMWWHVPTSCEDPEVVTHPEGGPICGLALMNPMVHRGLKGITVLDHYAFDLRDEDASVLRLAPVESCVIRVRP